MNKKKTDLSAFIDIQIELNKLLVDCALLSAQIADITEDAMGLKDQLQKYFNKEYQDEGSSTN